MKAKNLLLAGALAALAACTDRVLGTEPQAFSGTTTYYTTPDQIDRAVVGAYGALQPLYANGLAFGTAGLWTVTEMRSDNTTFMYNPANRGQLEAENIDEMVEAPSNVVIEGLWTRSYKAILQSDIILDRIEEVTYADTAQTRKNLAIGEAKFLRALNYFNLVRLFGAVPLRLHEVKVPSDAYTETRAPVDSVYAQIVSDLQDAAAKLPATRPAAQAGRATKGAAMMMLGDAYLQQKKYQDAITALTGVVGSGYSLLPSYAGVFDPANKNSAESIFAVQFSDAIVGEQAPFFGLFAPITALRGNLLGFTGQNGSGYNIPTRDMIAAYEPGDQRKAASIAYYVADTNRVYDVASGDTIPYIRKYAHVGQAPGRYPDNWPVYRYAEALLSLGEALTEVGRTGEALGYVNQVRQRAGLAPLSGLSTAGLRDAIRHEERVELAFENKRWFQLQRTGLLVPVMTAHGTAMKAYETHLAPATYQVPAYKALYPIPQREIRLNGFEQNPGW